MTSMGTPALFGGFTLFVLLMLAIDLGVFRRREHAVSSREALVWSLVWIALALAFNGGIYVYAGPKPALEFLTGYLIEKALSVDNLFVFLVIFSVFRVPATVQHPVLFWGVLGALVLRGVFVLAGATLLHYFHWLVYVFGGFLVLTGLKLFRAGDDDDETDLEKKFLVRAFRRFVPMTAAYDGKRFFVRHTGRWVATPLLLVLVVVEVTDVIFALDSVPAVLAITKDPFLVWTSNVFAILGLRSLFFLLAGTLERFHDLKYGLALVLIFVGGKMLASEKVEVPIPLSLGIVAVLILGSMVVSLLRHRPAPAAPDVP